MRNYKKSYKRRNYRKKRTLGKKSLRKSVKKIIKGMAEKKVQNQLVIANLFNVGVAQASWLAANQIPLTPGVVAGGSSMAIQQGAGQAARIGNRVRTHKCNLTIAMYPSFYNVTTNANPVPQDVRLIFYTKKYDKRSPLVAGDMSTFWQLGASVSAVSGTLTDMVKQVNKDLYNVYKDVKFKLGPSQFTGTGAPTSILSNNDYKLNILKTFDVTKFAPKVLVFNDTDNNPQNTTLFCAVFLAPADGTTPTATQTQPSAWTAMVEYHYTDL